MKTIDKNVSEMYDDELVEYLGNQLDEIKAVTANITLDRLQEICNAERERRLVVLPCKVGDTLFWVDESHDEIYESPVYEIGVCEGFFTIDCMGWKLEDFGKTVFLTKEEAEQALKGGAE